MLSPDKLQRLRDQLLEERKGLQEDLDNLQPDLLVSDTNAGVGNHPAEDADLTFQQEQIVSLRLNQQNVVDRIDRALKRMHDGTYGNCERCGREIDFARLKAEPYANLCIDCQRIAEH
jgi:RNA polymerase-binding protein DksA